MVVAISVCAAAREAELGDRMQKLTNSSYNAGKTARANGMWSTWDEGQTGPSQRNDTSCVSPSLKGIKMLRMIIMYSNTRTITNFQQSGVSVNPGDTNIAGAWPQYVTRSTLSTILPKSASATCPASKCRMTATTRGILGRSQQIRLNSHHEMSWVQESV